MNANQQSEDKNLCTSYIIKTNTWLKSLQSWYKSNYTFFLNRYNKRYLLVWFLITLKQLWNLTPAQILWPQVSCTGCDLVAISNIDPWTHANIMKCPTFCFFSADQILLASGLIGVNDLDVKMFVKCCAKTIHPQDHPMIWLQNGDL